MKVKHVPAAPDDLAFVEDAQRAVPLVPDSQDDCCARILDRTDLVARDEAATWLTFLRGLGLVERGQSGYSRVRREPDPEFLREAFLTGVFGTEDVLGVLRDADEPLTAAATFERVRDAIPEWERHKNPNTWTDIWTETVENELDWLVLLGLAAERDGGYVAAD
ncbi:hypothetical protein [Haloarchaeobius litoreus]|uniref:Uncharacterized protein n=1 Tax=Haloarchaeobius litoreus TaxID=755306 RepID=A0ABD6DLL4_9EURY|nr:hypothetical protein [Haloarchaeobius litoreus]